jgi:hypothetical protein
MSYETAKNVDRQYVNVDFYIPASTELQWK